ncbi:MAG: DNA polymerase III subunit delta [Propionibacteriaceae bacterium]|nr:DNA polymerase III subunit delta [Propionibacteriaceae bacterium]
MKNQGSFGQTLLIVGAESFLAERAAAEFIDRTLSEHPDTDVRQVRGAELSAGVLTEMAGGSLFSSWVTLVVHDISALPSGLSDQLADLVANPGSELALALLHPGGVKGKALLDRIKKSNPMVVEALPVKPWDLPKFAVMEAKRLKGRTDESAASALIEAVGSDLRTITSALRQLIDDSTDGLVSETQVRTYFSGRAEATIYAITNDAMNGRTSQALGKLRWALVTGVEPPRITASFAYSLRHLGKYLDAADPYISDVDLAREIGVSPRAVKELTRQARDWRESGVAAAIKAVAIADAKVKGAATNPGFALEQLVMRVSGLRQQRS